MAKLTRETAFFERTRDNIEEMLGTAECAARTILLRGLIRELPKSVTLFIVIDGVDKMHSLFRQESEVVFLTILVAAKHAQATVKVLFSGTPGVRNLKVDLCFAVSRKEVVLCDMLAAESVSEEKLSQELDEMLEVTYTSNV
jgi:hypothetical protein